MWVFEREGLTKSSETRKANEKFQVASIKAVKNLRDSEECQTEAVTNCRGEEKCLDKV